MWAEDDFNPSAGPCLDSYAEPIENGTYIMYHGTTRQAAQQILESGFHQSPDGMLGRGVYVSRDLQKASRYPLHLPEHQRVVLKLKVRVGRVKRIDCQGHPLQKTWHDHGYDTAWCPPNCRMVKSGLEEDCVWNPSRITVIGVIHPKMKNISRITPRNNETYTMYHGTTKEAAREIEASGFRQSKDGMLGPGVYVSRDFEKASRYPLNISDDQREVLKLKVNVGKVKKIDCQRHPMQKSWHDRGYDTAWCPPNCGMVKSGLEEDCVWDPSRITIMGTRRPETRVAITMWAEDHFNPPAGACWLGGSAEPRENGTYIMYHGTTRQAAQQIMASGFRQSADGMLGRGVYVSRDLQKASRYPLHLPEHQRVVLKLKVRVGKVKKIDYQGHPLQKTWHNHGYDTAWCPPGCGMVKSGLEEDCVWDPSRITDDFTPCSTPCLGSCTEPVENGTYIMYHGTSRQAAQQIMAHGFCQSADGMLGRGVYVSRDLQKASRYPLHLPEHQRVVLKLKVRVGRVKRIDYQGHPLQKTWHNHGYDTAWCPPGCGMVKSGLEEDCVWDPSRITVIGVIYPKTCDAMHYTYYTHS
uniref:Grass carp reovirus (GCRV)-induced gene 2p n=1 Tax=Scleropages formosus TaxID=113540 RepID=A0A8C9V0E1_SCLFO